MWQKIREHRRQILLIAVALLWLGVAVACAVKCFYPPDSGRTVFHTFYHAAESFRLGESPYFPEERGFQYNPIFAAALTPLTYLPYQWASLTWSFINLGVLFIGAYFFARRFLAPRSRAWFLIAVIPLAWEGIYVFQSNPLLGGLLMLGAVAVAAGNFWRGAFALLIPGIVKIQPLCFPILIAAVFPRRLIGRSVAVLAAIGAALFLCAGADYAAECFRGWFAIMNGKADKPYFHDAFGLYQYVTTGIFPHRERIYDMRAYRVVELAAAAMAFLFVLKITYRDRWHKNDATVFAYAAGAWWLTLFGPAIEIATMSMMAGGLAWTLFAGKGRRGYCWAIAAYVLATLGCSGDLEWHLRAWFVDYQNPTKALLPLGAICWGVWLFGYRAWRNE